MKTSLKPFITGFLFITGILLLLFFINQGGNYGISNQLELLLLLGVYQIPGTYALVTTSGGDVLLMRVLQIIVYGTLIGLFCIGLQWLADANSRREQNNEYSN